MITPPAVPATRPGCLADCVLMVRPVDFRYNDETGQDNEFQQAPRMSNEELNAVVMAEFAGMVEVLRDEDIDVLVLEKNRGIVVETPDAVFPNNWFSTEHDGTLIFYPMLAENRRAEKRVIDVEDLLVRRCYCVRNLINIGYYRRQQPALEGTGAMVIDHSEEIVYAAESLRCDPGQFKNFLHARHYREGILFRTASSTGRPIYHTNVMLSIGDHYAVVCSEAIPDEAERNEVLERLGRAHHVIEISMEQMEKHFCGNILQLRNRAGEPLTVMSARAYEGFTEAQRADLVRCGRLVTVEIPTIEEVGGGSARCMMAEIFLPRHEPAELTLVEPEEAPREEHLRRETPAV
ncbi:MAG: arginine deiminase-related protein [Longimicrobiales bacterium]|nr:arginine deiminase-related protein [Longimicrobiales bacterium]